MVGMVVGQNMVQMHCNRVWLRKIMQEHNILESCARYSRVLKQIDCQTMKTESFIHPHVVPNLSCMLWFLNIGLTIPYKNLFKIAS